MFPRIPFPLQFQVSNEHKNCFMGNLEEMLPTIKEFEQGKGFCDISICGWVSAGWRRGGQAAARLTATLALFPPSASLTPGPGTYQASLQSVAASPIADTYSIRGGGLNQAPVYPCRSHSGSNLSLVPIVPFQLPSLKADMTTSHRMFPLLTSSHNYVKSNPYNKSYPNGSARGYQEMSLSQVTLSWGPSKTKNSSIQKAGERPCRHGESHLQRLEDI